MTAILVHYKISKEFSKWICSMGKSIISIRLIIEKMRWWSKRVTVQLSHVQANTDQRLNKTLSSWWLQILEEHQWIYNLYRVEIWCQLSNILDRWWIGTRERHNHQLTRCQVLIRSFLGMKQVKWFIHRLILLRKIIRNFWIHRLNKQLRKKDIFSRTIILAPIVEISVECQKLNSNMKNSFTQRNSFCLNKMLICLRSRDIMRGLEIVKSKEVTTIKIITTQY